MTEKPKRTWTPSEIAWLCKYGPDMTNENIAIELGRSLTSVESRMSRLGIKKRAIEPQENGEQCWQEAARTATAMLGEAIASYRQRATA